MIFQKSHFAIYNSRVKSHSKYFCSFAQITNITRELSFCQWNVLSSSFHSILNLELFSSDDYESQQHFLFCIFTLHIFSIDSRVPPQRMNNFSSCLPAFFQWCMKFFQQIFTSLTLSCMWQQLSNPQELSTILGKFMRFFQSEVTCC